MMKLLATLALLALAAVVAIGPAAAQVPPIQPPPDSSSSGAGMTTSASNAVLPTAATNLSKWTTQIHQNTQVGECYGTGSGRVLCASDQNMDLIADHSTVQTQDASMLTEVAVGGTVTAGDVVGLTWTVAGTAYNIRYTVQAGDTASTIAANLASCIDAGGAANCTATAGFLAGLLAFHDANGFGYQPGASAIAAKLAFEQPWAASGNSVATYLSGGASETLTATLGNVLDVGPYTGTARLVPGRTPVAGDTLGMMLFQGQSASASGIDTQYAALVAEVLAQDPTNPQGALLFTTSDSLTGKNQGTKMALGNGVVFYDQNDTDAGCGFPGLGIISVCGQLQLNSATNPALEILPQAGANDGAMVIDTGSAGANSYLKFRYRTTPKAQIGQFGANLFGAYDLVNNAYGLEINTSTGAVLLGEGSTAPVTLTASGGAQVGTPTGGDKGAGKLNAAGLCVNGDCTVPLTDTAQSWTAAQRGTPSNIAISTATFTPNFNTAQNFEIDLVHASCPCTLANPSTTLVAGQSGMIEVHQSATGSDTIGTWGADYQYAGGTSTIALSTTASAVDYLPYYVNNAATGIVLGTLLKAPAH
jgi:hypothetical protein